MKTIVTILVMLFVVMPVSVGAIDYEIQAGGTGNFFMRSFRSDTGTVDDTITQVLSREDVRAVHGAFEYQSVIGTGRQTAFQFGGQEPISNAQAAQRFGWSVRGPEGGAAEAVGGEGWGRNLLYQGRVTPLPAIMTGVIEIDSDMSGRVGIASFECADGSCFRDHTEAGFRGQGAIGINLGEGAPEAEPPGRIIDFDKETTWRLTMPAVPDICPFAFP